MAPGDTHMDTSNLRVCPACGLTEAMSPFGPGRDPNCRACRSRLQKERYHRDPKARTLQIARSMNERMKRHAAVAAFIDPHLIADLIMQSSSCHYCQLPSTEMGRGFHVDHYIPLSAGGEHVLSNLVMCCEMCNRAKWNHSPAKYEQWLQGVAQRLQSL